MRVRRRTVGIDPKLIAQALVTILAFVLARFGIELDSATSGAIAVVLGAVAGYFAPAPTTEVKSG
jgi:hypothetical protein